MNLTRKTLMQRAGLNEDLNDVDYEKLVDLIAGADNDRNLKISYDSYLNGVV